MMTIAEFKAEDITLMKLQLTHLLTLNNNNNNFS